MKPEFARLLADIKATHARVYSLTQKAFRLVTAGQDSETLADAIFVASDGSKYCTDLAKEFNKIKKDGMYHLYQQWLAEQTGEPIRTPYVTVTPKVKLRATLPNQRENPEEFKKFMDFLGIPEELWRKPDENNSAAIHLHYTGMIDYITCLLEAGKPLPPGIDPRALCPEYGAIVRPTGKEIEPSDLQ